MVLSGGQWDQESLATMVGEVLAPSRPTRDIELKDTWRTRNSAFYSFRAFPEDPAEQPFDLVFKAERRWTPELAEGTFAALRRLADLKDLKPGPSAGIVFPEPLGWTREPPGLVMEYVEGFALFDALADSTHPLWSEPHRLTDLVRLSGEAFGWIHRLETIDPEPADVRERALKRLPIVVRWILLLVARPPAGSVVRSHNFSRNDFLVSPRYELCVLDPPSEGKPALLHEDLAWFNYQLLERLERRQALQLRKVFLDGHDRSSSAGPLSKTDRRAITICEGARALGTAKRLLLKRSYRAALRPIRIALGLPRRLLGRG